MPNNKKKVFKKKKSSFQGKEISANALTYRGPMVSPASKQQMDLHTMTCHYTNSLWASDSSGVIAATYDDKPDLVNDWSHLSNSFEEYRVLGHQLQYIPQNRYARGSATTRPICVVADRSTSGALSSYANATEHASIKVFSLDDPWTFKMFMDGSDEAVFQKTSSTVATRFIKTYCSGLSISTTYGVLLITYLIQFRGKA